MNIEISNLNIRYANREILSGINHIFEQGKIHAILGPNGCGKTTLVKYIVNNSEGRDRFSYVEQEVLGELDMQASEVVKLGRYRKNDFYHVFDSEDKAKVDEAIKLLDISDVINQNFDSLSGGEKQRVQIARAIAKDSEWIICDEPTANLDIKHQVIFVDVIKGLKQKGKSVIIVLHDINMAMRIADEIILLKEGKIIESGQTSQVMTEKNLETVFDTKFLRIENKDTQTVNFIYNV